MAQPPVLPQWATDPTYTSGPDNGQATRLEPTSGEKAQGYHRGKRVPARKLNWLLGVICDWIKHLDEARTRVVVFDTAGQFDPAEYLALGFHTVTFRGCGGGGGGAGGSNSGGDGGGGGGSGYPGEATYRLEDLPGVLDITPGAGGAGGTGSAGGGTHGSSGGTTTVSHDGQLMLWMPGGQGGRSIADGVAGGSGWCGGGGGGDNNGEGAGGAGGDMVKLNPLGNGSAGGGVSGGAAGNGAFHDLMIAPAAVILLRQFAPPWSPTADPDVPGSGGGGAHRGGGSSGGGGGGGGGHGHFSSQIHAGSGADGVDGTVPGVGGPGGQGGAGGTGYGAGGGGAGGAGNTAANTEDERGGDGAPGVVFAILHGGPS